MTMLVECRFCGKPYEVDATVTPYQWWRSPHCACEELPPKEPIEPSEGDENDAA